jgi:hypothetical protein
MINNYDPMGNSKSYYYYHYSTFYYLGKSFHFDLAILAQLGQFSSN